MDGWMDGWRVDGWMEGGWMDGWWMDGGWMDGWWMDGGWMDGGWMEGWMMGTHYGIYACSERYRSMNGVAMRDGEVILWGIEAMA
jgi:hypothetical protein